MVFKFFLENVSYYLWNYVPLQIYWIHSAIQGTVAKAYIDEKFNDKQWEMGWVYLRSPLFAHSTCISYIHTCDFNRQSSVHVQSSYASIMMHYSSATIIFNTIIDCTQCTSTRSRRFLFLTWRMLLPAVLTIKNSYLYRIVFNIIIEVRYVCTFDPGPNLRFSWKQTHNERNGWMVEFLSFGSVNESWWNHQHFYIIYLYYIYVLHCTSSTYYNRNLIHTKCILFTYARAYLLLFFKNVFAQVNCVRLRMKLDLEYLSFIMLFLDGQFIGESNSLECAKPASSVNVFLCEFL